MSELIGAEHGERRPQDRATHRNGYRARRWDTRAGEIELQIPKIRQGSYFPSILEPRRRSEQALLGGRPAGLCLRRLDPARRPARREPRPAGQQERGQPDLRRARRARRGVPHAAAGGPLPLRVPGCEGREGPRRRPRGQQGAGDRAWRARDRPARDPRARRRRGRDRGVLDRLPARPGQARPGRRAARDQRRARRPEGRDRQGARLRLAALHRALPARLPRPRAQGPARAARRR